MADAINGLKVLVADEDEATRRFLVDNLSADGADVESAPSCAHALQRIYSFTPEVIVADVNGDTMRLIEKVAGEVPIICLSAERDELDVVRKLERGADDLIVKPFSYFELRARVVAVIRRFRGGGRKTLLVGSLRIEVPAREAWLGERRLELSKIEFNLLCRLASDPSRVFTKDELLRAVWHGRLTGTRTLDSHACRLRHKLTVDGDRFLENVWGVGYRLVSAVPDREPAVS
jgi:DNA-binding response OmpR family regulator